MPWLGGETPPVTNQLIITDDGCPDSAGKLVFHAGPWAAVIHAASSLCGTHAVGVIHPFVLDVYLCALGWGSLSSAR